MEILSIRPAAVVLLASLGMAHAGLAAGLGDDFSTPHEAGSVPTWQYAFNTEDVALEAGEPSGPSGSLWVRWTAPDAALYEVITVREPIDAPGSPVGLDPVARVFRGGSFEALTEATAHVTFGAVSLPFQFRAVAGAEYRIQAGLTPLVGWLTNQGSVAPTVPVKLGWNGHVRLRRVGERPLNDDFAAAADLGTGEAIFPGTNAGASAEAGESLGVYESRDTVWHRWTVPPDGGTWELTVDSPSRLKVARFSGSSVESLVSEASAEFYPAMAGGTGPLRMRWRPTAGTTLHFRLNGRGYAAQGDYTLGLRRMSPPANDEPAAAEVLQGAFPLTGSGTTVDATPESGDLNPGNNVPFGTVWWKWVAPADAWVQATATGGVVAVKENGVPMGDASAFAQRDTSIVFQAREGKAYLLRVAQDVELAGPATLLLDTAPGDSRHRTPADAIDLGSAVRISSGPVPTDALPAYDGSISLPNHRWLTWTAPFSGWFSFDAEGSSLGVALGLQTGDSAPTQDLGISYGWPMGISERRPDPTIQVARLLHEVQAGKRYWLRCTVLSSIMQVNIGPAAPPPSVAATTVRELPGAPDRPRFVEIETTLDTPNGFMAGEFGLPIGGNEPPFITGLPNWSTVFDERHRVAGDAFHGTYRRIVEMRSNTETVQRGIVVSVADRRGGFSSVEIENVWPAIAKRTGDTQPPLLESIEGLPESFVISEMPQIFAVRMVISDRGGSGFSEGAVFFAYPSAPGTIVGLPYLFAFREASSAVARISAANRVSGDAFDGIYEVVLTVPPHWRVEKVPHYWLRDAAGNQPAIYEWANLGIGHVSWNLLGLTEPQYFFPLLFASYSIPLPVTMVQGAAADTASPAVDDLSVAVDTQPSPSGPFGEISVTFRIEEALSGFADGACVLLDRDGLELKRVPFTAAHRTAGTAADGTYRTVFPVPRFGVGGRHFVQVIARDASGWEGKRRSEPFELPDRTMDDQRAPKLAYFQMAPSSVDLRNGPATVHAWLGANDDTAGLSGSLEVLDPAGKSLAAVPVNCESTTLACDFDITLPQRDYLGASRWASVILTLRDSAGRTVTYGSPDSPEWPSEVALAVQNQPPDLQTQWASAFPGYRMPVDLFSADTDADGTNDAVEFGLGTDPTLPWGPGDGIPRWSATAPPPTPLRVRVGADPRSHRAPRVSFGEGDPLPVEFSYRLAPRVDSPEWAAQGWLIRPVFSSDLQHWAADTAGPVIDDLGGRFITRPRGDFEAFRLEIRRGP